MSSTSGSGRDRELENLVGQFLVASFQTDKLAELIYEKLSFRGRPKEFRLLIPPSDSSTSSGRYGTASTTRPTLLLTLRIEPYSFSETSLEKSELNERKTRSASKIFSVLESPTLDIPLSGVDPEPNVEEMLEGSFGWWDRQGQYRNLKLDEWKISTSIIDAEDKEKSKEIYRILNALAAKRSGEHNASP